MSTISDSELQQIIDSHEKGYAMYVVADSMYLMAKELKALRSEKKKFHASIRVKKKRSNAHAETNV